MQKQKYLSNYLLIGWWFFAFWLYKYSRGSKCKKEVLNASPEQFVYVGRGVLIVERGHLFGSNAASDVKGVAIEMKEKIHPSLSELPSDLFFAQNFPSLTCAHILNPNVGDLILDMCAAPGGKAGHIAYLLKAASKPASVLLSGQVIAIDRTPSKVEKVCPIICDKLL